MGSANGGGGTDGTDIIRDADGTICVGGPVPSHGGSHARSLMESYDGGGASSYDDT